MPEPPHSSGTQLETCRRRAEAARVVVGGAPGYGPSGWEQFVFDSPVMRDYNVQLESPIGTAVSQINRVQTRPNCNENLLQINFVQNH